MNADGSGAVAAHERPWARRPAELVAGRTKIAFVSTRDAGNPEIYVMNADGTGPTRLTNNPVVDQQPSWSPDGQRIAFTSQRDGNPEIYVMNADGSGPTRLTINAAADSAPNWQRPVAAPPANTCGSIQGHGALRENPKARFGFNVRYRTGTPAPTGFVHVLDRAAGMTFDSDEIASLVISGDDATASGSGSANGQPVTFTLRVHDEPDSFSLELSNSYSSSDRLRSGKIEINPCP